MTIGSIMNMAQSALQVAQTQVQTTSDNVTNVNTPGYARKIVDQQELVAGGKSEGVSVLGIQNVANQFLTQANLTATAQSSAAAAVSNTMDQAQTLLGDPTSTTSFFSGLDTAYAALSTASDSAADPLLRQSAVTAVSNFLQSAQDVATNLSTMQSQASQQAGADVTSANTLLQQISTLNASITQASLSGGDATGPQDQQTVLLNKLAGLMDIKVSSTATGGVTVRSSDGVYLAGDQGGSTLSLTQSGQASMLTATPPSGVAQQIAAGSGDIGGQLQLAQVDLPQLSAQLGQYVSQAVTQLNAASNASTAVPAPSSLTGTAIGMALPTAVSGFSGKTTIAIVNSAGVVQQSVAIDFSAGTMSVNGAPATGFTSANFLTSLNTALGGAGTASFTNGALSLSASGSGNGVAIADDSTTPSANGGQGFSQFFGLNNLVSSTQYTNFTTGLTTADPNTFSGTVTLQLADANGANVRQTTVTMPTGGTVGDMLAALNAGVGSYGSFSLNGSGQMVFTSGSATPVTASVANDTTVNSAGGPSLSKMFGIGDAAQSSLLSSYSVRPDIASNAAKLPFAELNLSAASGTSALSLGDGSGALAMAQSGSKSIAFAAGGGVAAATNTVTAFASQIAGRLGVLVANADTQQQTTAAAATQASSQLSSAVGVNLDQELVNLTTYQQAYSASARLIQAANSMYDSLLQMIP